jgi:hypothetical protein
MSESLPAGKGRSERTDNSVKSFDSHHEEIEFPLALVDIIGEVAVKGHKVSLSKNKEFMDIPAFHLMYGVSPGRSPFFVDIYTPYLVN